MARKYFDLLISFSVSVLIVYFGIIGLQQSTNQTDIMDSIKFIITVTGAWIALYYSTLRPWFRKPVLEVATDAWVVKWNDQPEPTLYLRLKIKNVGQTVAKNCVGRLVQLKNSKKKTIRIDPINFSWARQNGRNVPYEPIQLLGNGDEGFLDLAKYEIKATSPADNGAEQDKKAERVLRLQIASQNAVVWEEDGKGTAQTRDFDPGTYYLQIAIHADEARVDPTWFKLEFNPSQTDIDRAYTIKKEKP